MTDHSKEIQKAFKLIRYSPRDNQVDDVNKIVNAFMDTKYDNIVLSAPTGSGKSIIAAVTAQVCHDLSKSSRNASIILMHNNILVDQYHKTFGDDVNFSQLMGARNYTCGLLPTLPGQEASASDCVKDLVGNSNPTCNNCQFNLTRSVKDIVPHLITNYDYFFAVNQITDVEILKPRYMTVWDEAHTINEIFSMHNTIHLNEEKFDYIIEDAIKVGIGEEALDHLRIHKKLITKNRVVQTNYIIYIEALIKLIVPIQTSATYLAGQFWDKNDRVNYVKFNRIFSKYKQLNSLLYDFIHYEFEHVFQKLDKEILIKPVFVGKEIFDQILGTSEKNLFMSATVTKEFLVKTLGLNPEKTKEIILDSVFKKENKKFVFVKPISLNNSTLQDPEVLKHLTNMCKMITNFHSGESGIILTPSFKLAELIANELKNDYNVIEHVRGGSLIECVELFKNSPGSVLVSPSLFEGLNLEGDVCRYQVLVKAPFPSLADDRMKYIMDTYPDLFSMMTLMKIVQGAGRGVRNKDDHAVTYALDSNIRRLFMSKDNIWKDEFEVVEF